MTELNDGDMCSTPQAMTSFAWLVIALASIVVGLTALATCGGPQSVTLATDPTTSTDFPPSSEVAKPEIPLITALSAPATVTMTAIRVDPPETTTTVDYDALADAEYADFACAQWAGEAIAAGWPAEQMPKVLRTMWRESRCDMNARSTTSDSCAMQINDIVLRDWRFARDWPNFDRSTIFTPHVCLSVAHWLWTIDGWTPWRGGA